MIPPKKTSGEKSGKTHQERKPWAIFQNFQNIYKEGPKTSSSMELWGPYKRQKVNGFQMGLFHPAYRGGPHVTPLITGFRLAHLPWNLGLVEVFI